MRTLAAGRLAMIALLLAGASSALAHHSFTAEFDRERPITVTGVVYKVDWTNPHVWFYINVISETTGEVQSWGVELAAPSALERSGWGPDSLSVGQEVKVDGWMSRNGSPRINSGEVVLTATGQRPGATP